MQDTNLGIGILCIRIDISTDFTAIRTKSYHSSELIEILAPGSSSVGLSEKAEFLYVYKQESGNVMIKNNSKNTLEGSLGDGAVVPGYLQFGPGDVQFLGSQIGTVSDRGSDNGSLMVVQDRDSDIHSPHKQARA